MRGSRYRSQSPLDAISATRRNGETLVDEADRGRMVPTESGERPVGGISDLPAHAILDRGAKPFETRSYRR
jgi:hypothetical protein